MYTCVHILYIYIYICVCIEREGERERESGREREIEREWGTANMKSCMKTVFDVVIAERV